MVPTPALKEKKNLPISKKVCLSLINETVTGKGLWKKHKIRNPSFLDPDSVDSALQGVELLIFVPPKFHSSD